MGYPKRQQQQKDKKPPSQSGILGQTANRTCPTSACPTEQLSRTITRNGNRRRPQRRSPRQSKSTRPALHQGWTRGQARTRTPHHDSARLLRSHSKTTPPTHHALPPTQPPLPNPLSQTSTPPPPLTHLPLHPPPLPSSPTTSPAAPFPLQPHQPSPLLQPTNTASHVPALPQDNNLQQLGPPRHGGHPAAAVTADTTAAACNRRCCRRRCHTPPQPNAAKRHSSGGRSGGGRDTTTRLGGWSGGGAESEYRTGRGRRGRGGGEDAAQTSPPARHRCRRAARRQSRARTRTAVARLPATTPAKLLAGQSLRRGCVAGGSGPTGGRGWKGGPRSHHRGWGFGGVPPAKAGVAGRSREPLASTVYSSADTNAA